jgi:hypothetical protein
MEERDRLRGKLTEEKVLSRYKRAGWDLLVDQGKPIDFVMAKKEGGKITRVAFVEVKAGRGDPRRAFQLLGRRQKRVAYSLLALGVEFRIEFPKSGVLCVLEERGWTKTRVQDGFAPNTASGHPSVRTLDIDWKHDGPQLGEVDLSYFPLNGLVPPLPLPPHFGQDSRGQLKSIEPP